MITHRKPADEYVLCMERVEKYYVLQSLRRDQGYLGAALFYQNEAKRWHDRAMESRHQWLISGWRKPELRILNVLIDEPCANVDQYERSTVVDRNGIEFQIVNYPLKRISNNA